MTEEQPGPSRPQPQQLMQSTNNTIIDSTIIKSQISGLHNTLNIFQQNTPSKYENLSFEIPGLPVYDIIGRDKDLQEITDMFQGGCKRVAICGMGGMGKTTLAIYCAHIWTSETAQFSSESPPAKKFKGNDKPLFKNAVYFSVENLSNLVASVRRLAKLLSFSESAIKNQSVEVLFKEILKLYQKSDKNENFLVILDNLVQVKDVIGLLNVSKQSDNVYILTTSQNVEIDMHFEIYNLSKISEEESLKLFLNVTGLKIQNNENFHLTFHELYELVDGLPISVSHSATWISQTMKSKIRTKHLKPTVESYIFLLKEYIRTLNVKLKEDFPPQFDSPISKSAYLALKLNIDKLSKEYSKRLLTMLSYSDPAHIVVNMYEILFDEDEFELALVEISQFSLIYIEIDWSNNRSIRIHRLVQEVARAYLESECEVNISQFIITLLCDFNNGNTHLTYMFGNLDARSKITQWFSLTSKEDLQAIINRKFELEKPNETLNELKELGCDIKNFDSWTIPHKLMSMLKCSHDFDAAIIFLILDLIFEKFYVESLSNDADDGITLHHIVAANWYFRISNIYGYLCEKGININKKTARKKLLPLHIIKKYEEVAQIVSAGVEVNVRDVNGDTPLHAVCKKPYYGIDVDELVCTLIQQPGIQLDAENCNGETPLMIIANQKHWNDIARPLLEAGARYDFKFENGDTILHRAVRNRTRNLIERTLTRIKSDEQISVNEINLDGETPSQLAISLEYYDIAQLLLDSGARYDFRFENGDTILHRVIKKRRWDLMEYILNRIKKSVGQINVDDGNLDGNTSAHLAVSNKYDENGDTISSYVFIHVLKQLVTAKANLNVKNSNGQTPLDLAEAMEFDEEVIKFLKNKNLNFCCKVLFG